ncbi:MAG: hypothetical protein JW754_05940, partial [Candidatus Aenigmarchaeota archaeon]|nr:hypothetical protein [Candidatus Aenigmarchaeota archaeon]
SRDLGWGYVPISWEGWLVVLFFLLVIFGFVSYFIYYMGKSAESGIWLTVWVFASIGALVLLCETKVKK